MSYYSTGSTYYGGSSDSSSSFFDTATDVAGDVGVGPITLGNAADILGEIGGFFGGFFGASGEEKKQWLERCIAGREPCGPSGDWTLSEVENAVINAPTSVRERVSQLVAGFSGDFPQAVPPDRPRVLARLALGGARGGFDCNVGGREEDLRNFLPGLISQYGGPVESGSTAPDPTTSTTTVPGGTDGGERVDGTADDGGGGFFDQLLNIAESIIRPGQIEQRAEAALGGAQAGAEGRGFLQAGGSQVLIFALLAVVAIFLFREFAG